MIHKRMTEAPFDAEELAVQTVDIAIARDDAHQLATARAERHLAAVGTIRAGGNRLGQFPGASLMPIGSIEQRAGGADFDAVAALRTVQPAAVCADDRVGAATARFDRVLAHPLVTDARATLTKNAALRIVSDHGR